MSKKMEELRDFLCDSLDDIVKKVKKDDAKLQPNDYQLIDFVTHSIKSIDTILAMEDYTDEYEDYSRSQSYSARGRGRNARRDNRGRYAANNNYRRNESYRGRSYGYYGDDDTKEVMLDHIEGMLDEAKDDRQKQMIMSFKSQIESL